MMHAVDNTTATNATLPNLQCNTKYSIWVYARGGQINRTSSPIIVSLQARGMNIIPILCVVYCIHSRLYHISPPAPPTPSNVTVEVINASSLKVAWRWASSGPAPNCFNTTTVTYHLEGGGESSLQLSDPAATEVTLTDLQCNTNYTITVVATAGEYRREEVARMVYLPEQGRPISCGLFIQSCICCHKQ